MGISKVNFIHIPKNGGMTVRREIEKYISPSISSKHKSKEYTKGLLDTMNFYKQHHGYEHARWRDLAVKYQNQPCVAIVRNPWSRTVSRYTFAIITKSRPKSYSFEEFLKERHEWGNKEYFWHRAILGWFNQKDYVTDEDGNLRCDILRLEKLNEDLTKYFKLDKIPNARNISNRYNLSSKTKLKENEFNKPYQEFYTPTTKKIIEDWYADDIDFFGFDFDSCATKNIWNKE